MNSIATTTSALLGPALGGALVAAVDYRAALIVNVVTFFCSTATLLVLGRKVGSLPPNDVRRPLYAEALEGMRAVAARRWVWAVLAMDVSHILLAVAPWLVLLPTISVGHYGPCGYGLLMASFAAGGLCGGLIAMRHRPRRPGLSALLAQALFVFPLLTLVPRGLSLWVLIVPYVVAGAGSEYSTVLWMSALQRTFPDQLMGRVMALSSLASTMLMPIGMAVTGAVAAVVGSSTLLLSGAVVIVVTTAAALTVPGVNRFADPPTAAMNNSNGSVGAPAAEEARHHDDS
jgi:MFS family permease